MRDYVIITDSSSNLTPEQMREIGVDALVPFHLYAEGKEYLANDAWIGLDAVTFYSKVGSGLKMSSTQATSNEYEAAFRKYLAEGYDILSISCAEALSSSVKESIIAKERVEKDYPEAKIYCLDSYNCCYSLAMLVAECAKKRANGESIEDVYNWAVAERPYFNEVGTVENLTYLRNAGRVSASAAFFGGIFSIKPMIVYDATGHNVAIEKVRGRKTSLDKTAEYIFKYADLDKNNSIYLSHADCLADCEYVAELIKAHYPDKNIDFHFGFIEPGIGYSVGPGTIIVNFYGDPAIRRLNEK